MPVEATMTAAIIISALKQEYAVCAFRTRFQVNKNVGTPTALSKI